MQHYTPTRPAFQFNFSLDSPIIPQYKELVQNDYYQLSGERMRDRGAKLLERVTDPAVKGIYVPLRGLLSVCAMFYGTGVRLRNALYDHGFLQEQVLSLPVISVGNITAGGTGKTPLVEWIARFLQDSGKRPAILSRGYGAVSDSCRPTAVNDEFLVLEENLCNIPHLQGKDRVAMGRLAIARHGVDCLLLDDGFQHRRLFRDLDIVVVDCLRPFGFRRILPRGLLREPLKNLSRAHLLVLSRVDQVEREELERIENIIRPYGSAVQVIHKPAALRALADGSRRPPEDLRGQRVAAFCGIGKPEAFRNTLLGLGADVVLFQRYPDHYRYTRNDVEEIISQAVAHSVDAIVTTQKDSVKFDRETQSSIPILDILIEIEVVSGREQLEGALRNVVGGA